MERVIRVNRSRSGGGGQHPQGNMDQVAEMKSGEQKGGFINMQTQMEGELERRRKDWEKEVEQMQVDFFNVKLPQDNGKTKINANKTIEICGPAGGKIQASPKIASKGMGILEIGHAKTIYSESKDGVGQMVKFNFDVRGFDPSGITVRAEGSKLNVIAEYEEECYPGSKNTRRHNRQVDIPVGVDPDQFVSRLSADGILTVEAPVDEVQEEEDDDAAEIHIIDNRYLQHGQPGLGFNEYSRMPSGTVTYNSSTPRTERIISSSRTSSGKKKRENPVTTRTDSRTVTPKGITIYRSPTSDISPTEHASPLMKKQFEFGDPNVVSTEEGHRLKISVTLGVAYKPEEITVELLHRKIIVKAIHEEVIAGRSSKSEFSREFDIPGPVEPRSFKAVLSNDGKLVIGGSLAENDNHDSVMALVYCDMPLRGRAVKVILH